MAVKVKVSQLLLVREFMRVVKRYLRFLTVLLSSPFR